MKYRLVFVVLSVLLWFGCYEENMPIPTEEPELRYTVPQGDHEFDSRIVDWNKRCGFYILYKYKPQDVYWNKSQWTEAIFDSVTKYPSSSIRLDLPDENYVGDQLAFLEKSFLNFYPDSFLYRCMPMKLLLAKNLQYASYQSLYEIDASMGFDNIVVSHGDETLSSLSVRQRELLKDTVNILFLNRLVDQSKISISADFTKESVYDQHVTQSNMYAKGFLVTSYSKTKEDDWKDYVKAIVKTPYVELTADPGADKRHFIGILHDKKDTENIIRRKYAIIIRFFKEKYGIDLQAIGNARGI